MSVYYNQSKGQNDKTQGACSKPKSEREKGSAIPARTKPSKSAHPAHVVSNIAAQVIVCFMLFAVIKLIGISKDLALCAIIVLAALFFYLIYRLQNRR